MIELKPLIILAIVLFFLLFVAIYVQGYIAEVQHDEIKKEIKDLKEKLGEQK